MKRAHELVGREAEHRHGGGTDGDEFSVDHDRADDVGGIR